MGASQDVPRSQNRHQWEIPTLVIGRPDSPETFGRDKATAIIVNETTIDFTSLHNPRFCITKLSFVVCLSCMPGTCPLFRSLTLSGRPVEKKHRNLGKGNASLAFAIDQLTKLHTPTWTSHLHFCGRSTLEPYATTGGATGPWRRRDIMSYHVDDSKSNESAAGFWSSFSDWLGTAGRGQRNWTQPAGQTPAQDKGENTSPVPPSSTSDRLMNHLSPVSPSSSPS